MINVDGKVRHVLCMIGGDLNSHSGFPPPVISWGFLTLILLDCACYESILANRFLNESSFGI